MGGTDRLADYKAKRDFDTTGEPSGAASNLPVGHRFVVQRHRASHLHYDLRLESAGVLLSWAVPKGPTLDPAVKRLAVHVEDHPLDYFDFEGIIPEGEYGGGDVIVWDWGTWESDDDTDPVGAVERGDLHFNLDGEKLAGRFVLVQRGRTERDWLLIKKDDDAAHGGWNPEDHPRSVKSGRTNDEVLAAPAQTWSSSASWAAPTADELAALDDLSGRARWQVGECAVPLSGLDDVVFPATGGQRPLTRRDLV
ncbi:MAG: ATP-dependent DNA ligase, partial [Acidimicrobiia bacterium]|nr:ATP-dependent DNA ligase [Acidimicrobiia bacterium]